MSNSDVFILFDSDKVCLVFSFTFAFINLEMYRPDWFINKILQVKHWKESIAFQVEWPFCFVIMITNSSVWMLSLRIFFNSYLTKNVLTFIFILVIYVLFLLLSPFLCFLATWEYTLSLLYSVTTFYLRFHEGRLECDGMHFIFRFLPALITAVLTNHLAWVPTVMPNGQPPIKIFLEKHSSQSVDMLAKTHPYNPLWAQLGR